MNKSHTDLGIEDQQLKLIFKKLFLIGDQLEKLYKIELNKNEEIQDIVPLTKYWKQSLNIARFRWLNDHTHSCEQGPLGFCSFPSSCHFSFPGRAW